MLYQRTGLLLGSLFVATSTALALVGCGSPSPATSETSSTPSPPASIPSASSAGAAQIAAEQSDVPKNLVECSQSGTFDAYLAAIKGTDPETYSGDRSSWQSLKAHGATDAYTTFFADSGAHCLVLATAGGPHHLDTAVSWPFIQDLVVKFPEVASASKQWGSGLFGIPPTAYASLAGGAAGTATGLGANSETYFCTKGCATGPGGEFTALWQNNAFDIIINTVNIDQATSEQIAMAINSRIDQVRQSFDEKTLGPLM